MFTKSIIQKLALNARACEYLARRRASVADDVAVVDDVVVVADVTAVVAAAADAVVVCNELHYEEVSSNGA